MSTFARFFTAIVALYIVASMAFVPKVGAAPAPTADLAITSFTITPSSPVQGVDATVNITVRNQGSGKAWGFVVQWKSDRNAATGPSQNVASLNAGASTTVSFEYAFPRSGNFTTVATVDTNNTVAETNETNNVAILATTVRPTAPDLYVTDMRLSPAQPIKGQVTTIEIDVTNKGTGPAGAFVVQWKSDRNAATGPAQPVTGLDAGETTTVQFQYTFPQSGNFLTVVNVDTANTVNELDEANNLEILPITVLAAGIDLTITELVLVPANPVQGRLAIAKIRVQNLGNTPAGAFLVKWQPQPLVAAITQQINGLAPGASTVVEFEHRFPLPGTFQTVVTVDSTNRVREVNENNNTLTKQIVVEPPRPDLIISSFTVNPSPAVAGLQTTASIVVQNIGNTAAGPFVVNWKPTPLAPALTIEVDGLGVGESRPISLDFNFPLPGTVTSVATVDATRRVAELREDNNTATIEVVVEPAVTDLVITDMRVHLGQRNCVQSEDTRLSPLVIGDNVRVTQNVAYDVCITVQNQGNSPTGPFLVQWSPNATTLDPPGPSTVSQQVNTLGAGEFTTVVFRYTWTKPGNFRTVAKVDAFNTVRETNESNNLDILNVNVDPTPVDITITSLSIIQPSEGNPVQGATTTMRIAVTNLGSAPAGKFVLEWNPQAPALNTPGPATVSTQVDGLQAGQTKIVQLSFVYGKYGNFRSVVKADAFNNVVETNEANNEAVLNVVVSPAPVDLVVSSFTLNPSSPVRGSRVTASITVRNNGTFPANNFSVKWKPDTALTTGPVAFVDGLNPGESRTITLESTYFVAKEYSTSATVDFNAQVIETNETNNVFTRSINVVPRQSTLRVTFNNIRVYDAKEDGIDGNAEWSIFVALLDPNSNCTIGDETIEGVRCANVGDGGVDNGDTVGIDRTFEVTLVESTPLVLGSFAFEGDDFLGIPTGGTFTGYTLALWGAQDYLNLGAQTIEGQEGACDNGRCYDLRYTVQVLSSPPAIAKDLGAAALPAPGKVFLPAKMNMLIPSVGTLPKGVVLPAPNNRADTLPVDRPR